MKTEKSTNSTSDNQSVNDLDYYFRDFDEEDDYFENLDYTTGSRCQSCYGTGLDRHEDVDCLTCWGEGVVYGTI